MIITATSRRFNLSLSLSFILICFFLFSLSLSISCSSYYISSLAIFFCHAGFALMPVRSLGRCELKEPHTAEKKQQKKQHETFTGIASQQVYSLLCLFNYSDQQLNRNPLPTIRAEEWRLEQHTASKSSVIARLFFLFFPPSLLSTSGPLSAEVHERNFFFFHRRHVQKNKRERETEKKNLIYTAPGSKAANKI